MLEQGWASGQPFPVWVQKSAKVNRQIFPRAKQQLFVFTRENIGEEQR